MDLVMPELDGIEAITQIKAQRPETRILVLTTFAGEDKIFPAIKAGALGYQPGFQTGRGGQRHPAGASRRVGTASGHCAQSVAGTIAPCS